MISFKVIRINRDIKKINKSIKIGKDNINKLKLIEEVEERDLNSFMMEKID